MELMVTPEKRKILGNLSNVSTPEKNTLSPTANLKLLTNAASDLHWLDKSYSSMLEEHTPQLKPRKEKSLSLLCEKFLAIYPLDICKGDSMEIILDKAAESLGTERRRIYDIINVLESLHMASKACKNRYLWFGKQDLMIILSKLKGLALKMDLENQIHKVKNLMIFKASMQSLDSNNSIEENYKESEELPKSRDVNSLRIMCQKFLMLFLISDKGNLVSLEIAARVLLLPDENPPCNKLKTKVRRLYDIANILSSLGLVNKAHQMTPELLRKPAFEYTGPQVAADHSTDLNPSCRYKHSLLNLNSGLENTSKQGCKRKLKLDPNPRSEFKFNNILAVAEHELQILENRSQQVTSVSVPNDRRYFILNCFKL